MRPAVACGALILQALAHPWHQPAHSHQVRHELRERLGLVRVTPGEVANDALFQVDLELVTLLDGFCSLRRLQDRVAEVDRVAEEYPGERVGDHAGDTGSADGDRGDLTRRAAAKVGAGHDDVARRNLLGRAAVIAWHSFHRVLAQLLLVQGVDRVFGRDDLVRVDVVTELPGAPAKQGRGCHTATGSRTTSSGWVISPVIALAAATAGLDR